MVRFIGDELMNFFIQVERFADLIVQRNEDFTFVE